MLALLVAIVLLALAATPLVMVWVVRRSRDDDDDGGEPVENLPRGPDGPIDWASFDRERDRWEQTTTS